MRKLFAILLVLGLLLSAGGSVWAAKTITTSPTGYTCAEDVAYITVGGTVVNWGARGEDCTFLTTYAQSYYTGSYSWETLSEMEGGTGTSDAYTSELYKALQAMMKARHTKIQGYQDTRQYYQYTDCAGNDHTLISSFYSGKTVASKWTGSTYNREHIWPKSKCIDTNKKNDSADIMMLRATISSENSSRGNNAYGQSIGYFDPGEDVRGDCARMVLYGYVRWGNTGKMWGSSGVMESLDVLLSWMEADPVDTWEMGRNDAVQSITGVRNVFVDFPEYAWLLFGQKIPADLVTPSGNTGDEGVHIHSYISVVTIAATCTENGVLTYTCDCGDRYEEAIPAAGHQHQETVTAPTCTEQGYTTYLCALCGDSYKDAYTAATGHSFTDWMFPPGGGRQDRWCEVCGFEESQDLSGCQHPNATIEGAHAPTCTQEGFAGFLSCPDCGIYRMLTDEIPATGHSDDDANWLCDSCGESLCGHGQTQVRNAEEALCLTPGYTGDTYCAICGTLLQAGTAIEPTGEHNYSEWELAEDGKFWWRGCSTCGEEQTKPADCSHRDTELRSTKDATCGEGGYTGDIYCVDCGELLLTGEQTPATNEHTFGEWSTGEYPMCSCEICGITEIQTKPQCAHNNIEHRNQKDATCVDDGHSGDVYCLDCGALVAGGSVIPATGEHSFGDLIGTGTSTTIVRDCTVCGYRELYCYIDYFTEPTQPEPQPQRNGALIAVAIALVTIGGGVVFLIIRKKKH